MKLTISTFLTLLFLSPPAYSEPSAGALDTDSFRQELEDFRKQYDLTGMVVGVWDGGDPLFLEAFGESMPGVPAEVSMKFRAGGLCITTLTAVLLQTAEEGRVSLDDPISEWMPDLPQSDEVTLRMLANCTAGYGDYVPNEDFINTFENDPFQFFTPQQLIDFGMAGGMLYEPGTDWNYSHTNFVILGVILEKIHGKTIEELFQERIFGPLALTETVYTHGPALDPPVLNAFTTERGVFENSTHWNPSWTSFSGSIAAPLEDAATIIRAIGKASVIRPDSFAEMIAPTTVGLDRNTGERFYAMGIGVSGDWLMQNPNFGGYQGIVLYNYKTDQTLVAFVTLGLESDLENHHGMQIMPILMR